MLTYSFKHIWACFKSSKEMLGICESVGESEQVLSPRGERGRGERGGVALCSRY